MKHTAKFLLFTSSLLILMAGLASPGNAADISKAENPGIIRHDFWLANGEGQNLFVRKVYLEGKDNGSKSPVLLIHGGSTGGLPNYDLTVPGYSLAGDIASAGYAVYIMDVRGFGRSDPPGVGQRLDVPSEDAVRDIAAVVDWIMRNNPGKRVSLFGWATGGHWAGMYTAENNDKVERLIMLNTIYGVDAPWSLRVALEAAGTGDFNYNAGPFRIADRRQLLANWDRAIGPDKEKWRDPAVYETYLNMAFADALQSGNRQSDEIKIPGAFLREAYYMSKGIKVWEASRIKVPTLVMRSELDHWSRPEDISTLGRELVNAPQVKTIIFKKNSHWVFLEHGKEEFLLQLLSFLSSEQ